MKKAIALLAVLCMVLSGMGSAFAADFGSPTITEEQTAKVTFDLNEGNVEGSTENIEKSVDLDRVVNLSETNYYYGILSTGDIPTPTRENYDFDGWFDGEDEFTGGEKDRIFENITLTAEWSPLSESSQEAEEVTVSVENVKGGVLNTFDSTGMKSLPIGEEVKIPSGNMLILKTFGMNNASGDKITKPVSVSIKTADGTEKLEEFVYQGNTFPDTYMFTVTKDAVITGVFENVDIPAQEGMSVKTEKEYFPVTGADADVQTQLVATLDGQTISDATFSADNENFTVSNQGTLASKSNLAPGEYTVKVTVAYNNQTYADVEVSVKVGSAVKVYQYIGENMGLENGPNLIEDSKYPTYFAKGTTLSVALAQASYINYQSMYNYEIDTAVFSDANGNKVTSDADATTGDVNIFHTRYVNESGQRYTLTVPTLANEEEPQDEQVTVSIENVKGGVINTFDSTGMQSLPIGEEVKVVSGNMLILKTFGMNNAAGDKITKSVSVSAKTTDGTEQLKEFVYGGVTFPNTYMLAVTKDTVITGVFENVAISTKAGMSVKTEKEYFPVEETSTEVETQLVATLDETTISNAKFLAADTNFTVSEAGLLKSKAALAPGEYTVKVTVAYNNQTYADVEVSVKVGAAVKVYQYIGENMGLENGPNLIEDSNYPTYFAKGTTLGEALTKASSVNYQPMYNYNIDTTVFSDVNGNKVTSDAVATTRDVNIFYTRYIKESGQRYALTVPTLFSGNTGGSDTPEEGGSSGNSKSGGSSGSGSTSMISNNSSLTTTTNKSMTVVTQLLTVTTGTNGVATGSVTKAQISEMIKLAKQKAQEQNKQIVLEIKVKTDNTASGIAVNITKEAATTLSDGADGLIISAPILTVNLDKDVLNQIRKNITGDFTITALKANVEALSDEDKAIIGDRPVYDLKINSGSTTITDFGGGKATVSVPYTPAKGEDANKIVIYYISNSGQLITVPDCIYDESNGMVTFKTTHFSSYAIGYNDVSFSDVSGWYAPYVNFLSARELINGTGDENFSPNANITRAEFVKILAKLSGSYVEGAATSPFSDVAVRDWYFTPIQWAYENDIVYGSDGKFKPNDTLTRQDIAVMISRYAEKVANYQLPEKNNTVEFTDSAKISSYAASSVTAMQRAGIITGGSDGSFAPKQKATRAQTAKMIALLLQDMLEE